MLSRSQAFLHILTEIRKRKATIIVSLYIILFSVTFFNFIQLFSFVQMRNNFIAMIKLLRFSRGLKNHVSNRNEIKFPNCTNEWLGTFMSKRMRLIRFLSHLHASNHNQIYSRSFCLASTEILAFPERDKTEAEMKLAILYSFWFVQNNRKILSKKIRIRSQH